MTVSRSSFFPHGDTNSQSQHLYVLWGPGQRGDCSLNRVSIKGGKDAYVILSERHTMLGYHGNGHYR